MPSDSGELLDRFLSFARKGGEVSNSTLGTYEQVLRAYVAFLNEEGLKLCATDSLNKYLGYLYLRQIRANTVLKVLSALSKFYDFLVEEGECATNPVPNLPKPKKERKLPVFLTEEETKKLLESAKAEGTPLDIRDRAILELLYATGCRVSELTSIKMKDVFLHRREIRVVGKRGKERLLLFSKRAKKYLEKYIEVRDSLSPREEYLFVNRRGGRLTARSVQRLVSKYARSAGLQKRVTPHVLRHTLATHLLSKSSNLSFVQKILGHSKLSTTQIYTHVVYDYLKHVYKKYHPRA
jgi:site-specific recombinase XerD